MRPFAYSRPASLQAAVAETGSENAAAYLAGGTTMIDLMKLEVENPARLVDIQALGLDAIADDGTTARIGARVTMAQAAGDALFTTRAPVLSQALWKAASPQLRNVATLGGNLLQRTRCGYFRDAVSPCNKRDPGSGCAAIEGVNRLHAVLGTSERCIASYPGDFANALILFDARVETEGADGARVIPFAEFHVPPGETPEVETVLRPGELVTGFALDVPDWARRSLYLKVRDRQSYAFATASAAVALDLDGDRVREARIALGGVATTPWRAREAERFLLGKALDEDTANEAGRIAFAGARGFEHNAFKIRLGGRTLARALLDAATLA